MDHDPSFGEQGRPHRLRRRSTILTEPDRNLGFLLQLPKGREGWLVARRLRVARRGAAVILWTIPAVLIQAVCLLLPGMSKVRFARFYWKIFTRLIGVKVRIVGHPISRKSNRPVVFVSNHSSWVDIPVLGGVLDGCFVSKSDVARWPIIGTIARLGRTVFVSRSRSAIARERDMMRSILKAGDNLILFPEGTSSDGSRVLPFRTSFFTLAEAETPEDAAQLPLIQPISVVYDRLGGLPAGRAARPIFAWYGDMDIASHFWRLTQHIGLRATVLMHAPLDPARFADRKALAAVTWHIVADGASTLRQNRPARPLNVAADDISALSEDAEAAFA